MVSLTEEGFSAASAFGPARLQFWVGQLFSELALLELVLSYKTSESSSIADPYTADFMREDGIFQIEKFYELVVVRNVRLLFWHPNERISVSAVSKTGSFEKRGNLRKSEETRFPN